jgi:hypothetical protein
VDASDSPASEHDHGRRGNGVSSHKRKAVVLSCEKLQSIGAHALIRTVASVQSSMAIDCSFSYNRCAACDRKCGGGEFSNLQTFTLERIITRLSVGIAAGCSLVIHSNPEFGGAACPPDLPHDKLCNTDPCKEDCQLGVWGSWSSCSRTCSPVESDKMDHHINGKDTESEKPHRFRYRGVVRQPEGGGKACLATVETQECVGLSCPVDCLMSKWDSKLDGSCSECTHTCGKGERVDRQHAK